MPPFNYIEVLVLVDGNIMRFGVTYIPRGWPRDMDLLVAYAPRLIDNSSLGVALLVGGPSTVPPLECAPGIMVLVVTQPCLCQHS